VLLPGQSFARYVIEAPIGEGGMGEVYRAYDEKLRRKVALKVLHTDLAIPNAAARLVREARAAAALSHPNTVSIFDLGEYDGHIYLVMELVIGAPLRAYIDEQSVPITQKLRWLAGAARGIGAAHKAGLVHRDIKPTNVMVSNDGVVKVLDFGLAKPIEAASLNTDVGMVAGTPRYMAPELFTGASANAKSDQYSFGVMAYELLSGGEHPKAFGPVPAALDSIAPEITPAIARLVARTLSRAPEDRFPTMNDVAIALDHESGVESSTIAEPLEVDNGVRSEESSTLREPRPEHAATPSAFAPTDLAIPSQSPTLTEHLEPRRRSAFFGPAAAFAFVVFCAAAAKFYVFADDAGGALSAPPAADSDASMSLDAGDEAWELPTFVDSAISVVGEDAGDADASELADAGENPTTQSDASWRVVPIDDFADPWLKPKDKASTPPSDSK